MRRSECPHKRDLTRMLGEKQARECRVSHTHAPTWLQELHWQSPPTWEASLAISAALNSQQSCPKSAGSALLNTVCDFEVRTRLSLQFNSGSCFSAAPTGPCAEWGPCQCLLEDWLGQLPEPLRRGHHTMTSPGGLSLPGPESTPLCCRPRRVQAHLLFPLLLILTPGKSREPLTALRIPNSVF